MSKLNVNAIEPSTGTDITLGASGDTTTVPSGATLDISASTLTPPATMPASSGVNLTALNATNLGSGTVPTARLGTGTASSSTVLYGDQTYKAEPAGGITHASQWRLTTSFTGDTDPIASNLEETDNPVGFGVLGASMTQSSGVFTFPATGYWWIAYKWQGWASSNFQAILPSIGTTTDDGTWAEACEAQINIVPPTGSYYAEGYFDYILDVTSTSLVKCRFSVSASGANAYTGGSSDYHRTNFTFIRLGDT